MSEFVAEEYDGVNWPAAALPEEGVRALERPETAARSRVPASYPAPRSTPPSPPQEAEVAPELPPEPTSQAPKPRSSRRPAVLAAGLAAAALLAALGYVYLNYSAHFETTDDAFIAARQFSVAAKASGFVAEVPVADNQHVAPGDVIARIDDRDYRAALAVAEAQAAAAQANVDSADAQIVVQKAQIDQSQAQVESAQAALDFAEQQASRYQDLAQRGSGTVQNAQQFSSALRQQQAAVKTAQAALTTAQRQVAALQAQRQSAAATVAQAKAQLDQAKLNLSYTVVTAAQPGRVVSLSAAVGQFAAAGTSLAMFVPDEVWLDANFKETQLDAMRPGQPVTVTIDAYAERALHGHVASVQPGSGTAFSLLPAENATGNYVKVVQRVPVKIVLDDAPKDVAIGPGMSAVPVVRVDPSPSLYERIWSWL